VEKPFEIKGLKEKMLRIIMGKIGAIFQKINFYEARKNV
jgi:hypothetical protein